MPKDPRFMSQSFYLPIALLEKLDRWAREDNRNRSQQVVWILRNEERCRENSHRLEGPMAHEIANA